MKALSEEEIIRKIQDGELDYFEYIVKKYTRLILSYVKRKLFDKEDAEDIVQNAFLNFYKSINRFDTQRPILPYLYQIVKNEMKMFWRAQKKTVPLDEKMIIEEKEELIDLDFIKNQLEKLSKEQKKAIQLITEGFSYKEIAKFLGKPINTIRTIIRRARLKLKKP